MPSELRTAYGFYLNVADEVGKPTIFMWPVFPENVLDVQPNLVGGCCVRVKIANKEPFSVDVVQSPDFVREAIQHCRALDDHAGEHPPESSKP